MVNDVVWYKYYPGIWTVEKHIEESVRNQKKTDYEGSKKKRLGVEDGGLGGKEQKWRNN